MGVDDEYKMVSGQDDANDHLLERTGPITRSAYKKRSMFASVVVGALIGAAATFLFSIIFAPSSSSASQTSTAAEKVQTSLSTSAAPVATTSAVPAAVVDSGTVEEAVHPAVDPAHSQDALITDCGSTPAQAREKGCVFDVMMQLWMPPACYDEPLSERYLASGNWTWWADPEATQELSLEEMRKGEHPVIFVIQDYHKQHCIFAWEKLVRALRNEWPVIEELVSYDHVMHCKHTTLSKNSDSVRGVRAPTGWTRCGLYGDWEGRLPANSVSSTD